MNGSWRRRSNLELYKIYKQPDIVKFVKLQRLKWAGHLARMNEDRCCKKIFLGKPMGNRPRGRHPLRWIDCVEKVLKILKVEIGKQLPKVGVPGEDFWRSPGSTQGCRAIEEER
ncbi:putative endonuclease-reverse transcriptase [Trichonephila clavipes]|nr:putative endonuclease-reverse transcriptase [Trichonephila clavipes]